MRDKIYFNNPWQLSLEMMEDQFFSYCGVKKKLNFKVPNVELARKFALDACFEVKDKKIKKSVPFAIHKFNFISFSWKQKISELGFNLPEVTLKEWRNFKKDVEQMKICFWEYKLYQSPNSSKIKASFKKVFPKKVVTLWGYGTNGNRCQNLFNLAGIKISCIYDNAFSYTKYENGTLYTSFYQTGLKDNTPILISTSYYEDEVSDKLTDLGLKKNQEFFLFSEIERNILKDFFNF